ncbi:Nuclear envelope protein ndc1 [Sphaceloma murrayae]|uniref:Nuclear envelope protein ndc1 n=1 Tax=Sphaceloma murrayae TaxID=2082308 RepID=A0A2K1QX06_9PEZI|nr:Nuclear envelope protein ndc1 [Sphaceloma murrayae]
MSAVSGPPNAGMKPPARTRPYKDFLTPALHRCFTNAALVGLLVCWIDAILMSKPHFFWSWFPFSMTGLRMGLLFVSCLTIFVLRVAYMHIGRSIDRSTASDVWKRCIGKRAVWTVIWYWTSGFLFSEVYIFSTAPSANLAWIDPGRSYERLRLNERVVMLRCMFGLLSIGQALRHLRGDYDALEIPRVTRERPDETRQRWTWERLKQQSNSLALQIGLRAVIFTFLTSVWGPMVYFFVIRQSAWNVSYSIGKMFYSLHKSTIPPGLTDVFHLFLRFMYSSSLLVIMWQATNMAFTTYARQEPLKKGFPLTNESKDPNASLINGIKSRRELPHSIALWELAIIAERFEDRRRTIYSDFEKPGSSTWLDISSACLAEIEAVSQAVRGAQTALNPPPPAATPQPPPPKSRIAQPLRDNPDIFTASPRPSSKLESVANSVGLVAKSIGQDPGASPLGSRARTIMGNETPQTAFKSFTNRFNSYILQFLRSPFGGAFRIPFTCNITAIVLGHPHSRSANIHNAVQALCRLTVCSLKEDNFGQVQKDIGKIMRVLMAAIRDVQGLLATYPPHWTDVEFDGKRRAPEVEELVVAMKMGLEEIVMSFGEYADALGVSRQELRAAKELVGRAREMVGIS